VALWILKLVFHCGCFHNFYRNCWLWISRFTRIDEHEDRLVWLISGWQVTFYLRWQEETIFSNFCFSPQVLDKWWDRAFCRHTWICLLRLSEQL
jgi:hypothetical protein